MELLLLVLGIGAAVIVMRSAGPAEPVPDDGDDEGLSVVQRTLAVAGVGLGVAAVNALVVDPIQEALEKQELTFDWKHEIRDGLSRGEADHTFVSNPSDPAGVWRMVDHSRPSLRRTYDVLVLSYPRPSGVHSPFDFGDAWGWYTDYWVERWNAVDAERAAAVLAAVDAQAEALEAAAADARADAVSLEDLQFAQAMEQQAAMIAWWSGLA